MGYYSGVMLSWSGRFKDRLSGIVSRFRRV
jgi:hypothetical protein